ncbi:MAG TPA: muconolactone Delta-isomerase family protein [Acidimicrobiales bacterium]|nr:muconolactone Delta-isomerase family protein [Acidimicrobiales bacterium]
MQFVVMSRSVPDVDRGPWVQEEYQMVDELHASGFFHQIYVRSDQYGAISLVQAESEEVLREKVASLPFSANGCVEIEQVIAVTPRW